MNDPSMLLATSGGDTVKLFDVSVASGDPCTLSYTPSPGFQVNSVKWNHTNLVVASAGDDKKISLWRKNGQSLGTIPLAGSEGGDDEESISSISFSNKGSRYICSGGSGQVVRIWDLQRKRCIKWLRGHTDTITGAMYNCKDEHLASISLGGDVIIHNLASAARATELKDPNRQVLRVLDYSRISRHLLVTAGDDGSVHLWDSTNRSPKVSWLKQHSAPTAGVSFSPTNDKVIASICLDKKLYTLDSGIRRHVSCIPCEAPFSSLAFRDDGNILAAGTSSGRVVFYDVRGNPQPFTVLRAYGNSEADADIEVQDSSNSRFGQQAAAASSMTSGGCETDIVPLKPKKKSLSASCIEARREREQDAKQRFYVTYDATGVGLRAGRQAEVLKKIVFELPELPAERALAESRSLTGLLCHIPQVMYDATAVRLQAGRQPQTLNKIVCELTADNPLTKGRPLHGLLGHTPPQVYDASGFGLQAGNEAKADADMRFKTVAIASLVSKRLQHPQ